MVSNNKQTFEGNEIGERRGNRIPIMQSRQRHNDPKQAPLRNVRKGVWPKDYELYFERFFRKVVREELERRIQDYLPARAWFDQIGGDTSRASPFELRFTNKLPDIIFTHSNVISEDKTPIQIALFDVRDQSVVNVGPLSSAKVEICALNGEFGFSGSEDWTEGEFNVNILRERDGRRPLLNGDRLITLKNGVGCINKVMFTDNSRWIRSRKFRLGAKVIQTTSNEANIKEGRSEPFVVKDYRGESYKKHHPPSLKDDVWRLKQIAKDGKIHKRLSLQGIHTVKDLLRLYTTNPSLLLEKVGNISKRSWMSIIEHVKTCVIDDDETFLYQEQSTSLIFNSIYVLVGVSFDGQNYVSPNTLSSDEKLVVEIMKQHAYQNMDNLISVHKTPLSCLTPLACVGVRQSDATEQGLQQLDISAEQNGHGHPYASTSYGEEDLHSHNIYSDPNSMSDITDKMCLLEYVGFGWFP
ncbi:calmodulin-binding protein 60 G-like [Vigna radiata var. radiata]|uniref:Calmodulin-binding protein 60 G-like n=1 Tax=Vigna radiata var. radiata TaxID=3916 RepID=A0A3Q0FDM4_VIGRR|nr:calmodulin-binding protein 60 G-like [Vigna radiata var. radiata]